MCIRDSFTFVSSFVLAAIITLVTETVLSKRGEALAEDTDTKQQDMGDFNDMRLKPREKRGLRNAGIAFVIMLAIDVYKRQLVCWRTRRGRRPRRAGTA